MYPILVTFVNILLMNMIIVEQHFKPKGKKKPPFLALKFSLNTYELTWHQIALPTDTYQKGEFSI